MSRPELDAVSDHIWACQLCYQAYLTVLERRFPIVIDLDDLAGLKGWHLVGEELTAYLSGQLDDLDSGYARLHLTECAGCRQHVAEAGQYLTNNYSAENGKPLKPQNALQGLLGVIHSISSARLQPVAIAVLVLAVLALAWLALGPRRPQQIEVSGLPEAASPRVSPQVSNPDGPQLLAQADPPGASNTAGPSEKSEPRKVTRPSKSGEAQPKRNEDDALVATDLAVPPAIEMFDRSMAELIRGNGSSTQSFSIVRPFNTIVIDERPTFYWTPLGGAKTYAVSVFDRSLHLVSASGPLTETQWRVPERLRQDTTYTWIVTAAKESTEIVAPPLPARAEFRLLDKAAFVRLNRRLKATVSHSARGVLYARAGLLDEAEREFEAHLMVQPADEQAKKLLQTVKSWRRGESYRPPSPTTTNPAQ